MGATLRLSFFRGNISVRECQIFGGLNWCSQGYFIYCIHYLHLNAW